MAFIEANWLLILLVLVAALAIGWYIFHAARRTNVTAEKRDVLDEGSERAARNQALIDSPPAATAAAPVPPLTPAGLAGVGEAVEAAVESRQIHAAETSAVSDGDDLTRLKGVGPRLAAQLHELGVTAFAQIAAWSEADIDRIDASLGRFSGRIRRDSWVEQARYLAAGDTAGFAARFGAVS